MANPRLTIEFTSNGASTVKFSSIDGISPGRIMRAALQSRKELTRLCGVAGVEAARKKKAAVAMQEAKEGVLKETATV